MTGRKLEIIRHRIYGGDCLGQRARGVGGSRPRSVGGEGPIGDGDGQGLSAVPDPELPVDRPEMTLDRGLRQEEQLRRRPLVAQPLGESGEDVQFSFAQTVRAPSCGWKRATCRACRC